MPGLEEAIAGLISPAGLSLVIVGTALGIFVGAVPGLTGTMLIALVLPLTYGADPLLSMAFLISIYVGAVSGGMITANRSASPPAGANADQPATRRFTMSTARSPGARSLRASAFASEGPPHRTAP